jgi:hypothetical protein
MGSTHFSLKTQGRGHRSGDAPPGGRQHHPGEGKMYTVDSTIHFGGEVFSVLDAVLLHRVPIRMQTG